MVQFVQQYNSNLIFVINVALQIPLTDERTLSIEVASLSKYIQDPGVYTVKAVIEGKITPPYNLVIDYFSVCFSINIYLILQTKPDNHPQCCVTLGTQLATKQLTEGEGSEIQVVMENLDPNYGQPMTIARVDN